MEGVEVLTEAETISSASAVQVQSQPPLKTREAKCNKTVDDAMGAKTPSEANCHCCEPTSNVTAAEDLAKALEVKVNLESERCVNGMTNGTAEEPKRNKCPSTHSDASLCSESSSPCACTNTALMQNGSSVEEHQPDCLKSSSADKRRDVIVYVSYESELQMPLIMRIMNKDLSEPYSIYTYRYFIYNWPKLCFLAMIESECVGAIVCKLDLNRKSAKRGYIAMLAVDSRHRNKGIGSNLVLKAIGAMVALNADEVVLESEITNTPALRLYENLGFVRDKRLFRYYLNGVDAFRLKLWLK